MPFSAELGMNVWDPHESQRAAQPLAETAARAFERGLSQADKARQILKRNMAMEAMKIRTQELYSHMDQSPENFALAQRQAFLENAGGIFGENENAGSVLERLMASDEAAQVRKQSQSALERRQKESMDLRQQIEKQRTADKAKRNEIDLGKIAETHRHNVEMEKRRDGEGFEPEIRSVVNPITGKPVAVLKTSKGAATLLEAKSKGDELGPVQKAEVNAMYSRIKAMEKERDKIVIENATPADRVKRRRLSLEVAKLKEAASLLSKPQSEQSTAPPNLELKEGRKYRDANGDVRIYKGEDENGDPIWETTD